MAIFKHLGAAAALLSLAGLAQAGTVTRDDQMPLYNPTLVNYVTSQHGNLPAVVVNDPFSDASLMANIRLPGFFSTASVVAIAADERKDGHIVLVFDPARTYPGGKAVCKEPQKFAEANPQATLRLQAAFCYNDSPVTEAYLTTPRPSSPNDPAFRQSMAELMNSLLPSRIPDGEQCMAANC